MARHWKWFALLAGILAAAILVVVLRPPVDGRPADFRTNGVAEIEFSMPGSTAPNARTTNASLCLGVLQMMRTGRATRPHACPPMGRITVRYADGTTNLVTLTPGHGFGRIELGDATGQYSLSRPKLFGALKRAKLLPDDF